MEVGLVIGSMLFFLFGVLAGGAVGYYKGYDDGYEDYPFIKKIEGRVERYKQKQGSNETY